MRIQRGENAGGWSQYYSAGIKRVYKKLKGVETVEGIQNERKTITQFAAYKKSFETCGA
jgi:hypothetical protein